MPKTKQPVMPETIFVQRVIEGDDDPYLLAWDSLEDVDLDHGPAVGVYTLHHKTSVVQGGRTTEAI